MALSSCSSPAPMLRWLFARVMAGGAVMLLGSGTVLAQQDTITFGSALSLTGKVSTEGRLVKAGYDIYVDEINQRGGIKVGGKSYKVAIKYYDDQSDAATSVKLYEKLINEDGIKLLLGPYSSGITFAVSAVTEKIPAADGRRARRSDQCLQPRLQIPVRHADAGRPVHRQLHQDGRGSARRARSASR